MFCMLNIYPSITQQKTNKLEYNLCCRKTWGRKVREFMKKNYNHINACHFDIKVKISCIENLSLKPPFRSWRALGCEMKIPGSIPDTVNLQFYDLSIYDLFIYCCNFSNFMIYIMFEIGTGIVCWEASFAACYHRTVVVINHRQTM